MGLGTINCNCSRCVKPAVEGGLEEMEKLAPLVCWYTVPSSVLLTGFMLLSFDWIQVIES